jgi:glycosyltransferase involved in cell wall biosynthesis
MLTLAVFLLRVDMRTRDGVCLFYNRSFLYLPALMVARARRIRCVLDLEDGDPSIVSFTFAGLRARVLRLLFDSQCDGGALLACAALRHSTTLEPARPYYGVCDMHPDVPSWSGDVVVVLFSGTIAPETGAQILADSIHLMRRTYAGWTKRLRIEVTGKGSSIGSLRDIAQQPGFPLVRVHGRLTDADYEALLQRVNVGLALKPNSGPLAHTTFPSKVVEFAARRILVMSTDISDVREVLGTGAIYLSTDTPSELINALAEVVERPEQAASVAAHGQQVVLARCAPMPAALALRRQLFPQPDDANN